MPFSQSTCSVEAVEGAWRIHEQPGTETPVTGEIPMAEARPLEELSYREALLQARREATRRYLEALLLRHRGNVTAAATQAGIERESFHRLLRRHGLSAAPFRTRKPELVTELPNAFETRNVNT